MGLLSAIWLLCLQYDTAVGVERIGNAGVQEAVVAVWPEVVSQVPVVAPSVVPVTVVKAKVVVVKTKVVRGAAVAEGTA